MVAAAELGAVVEDVELDREAVAQALEPHAAAVAGGVAQAGGVGGDHEGQAVGVHRVAVGEPEAEGRHEAVARVQQHRLLEPGAAGLLRGGGHQAQVIAVLGGGAGADQGGAAGAGEAAEGEERRGLCRLPCGGQQERSKGTAQQPAHRTIPCHNRSRIAAH
jgi:hypothetical protein